MRQTKYLIDKTLVWILVGLMSIAVLNVLWQVISRWVLQNPSSYTEELARYLLIWLGLLGAAYAAGQKLHLSIDVVPASLSHRSKQRLVGLVEICVFLFALIVMVVGGSRLVALTLRFGQTSAALGAPLGFVYVSIPISGLLIMFYAAHEIWNRLVVHRADTGERCSQEECCND